MSEQAVSVVVRAGAGGRALFTLDVSADPQQGVIDLTDSLDVMVRLGLEHPYDEPADGVMLGTFSTEGDIAALVDGRELTESELAEAACAGFLQAILAAIRVEAGSDPAVRSARQGGTDPKPPGERRP